MYPLGRLLSVNPSSLAVSLVSVILFPVHSCRLWRSLCPSCSWIWGFLGAFSWQHPEHSWRPKSSLGSHTFRVWWIRKAKYCLHWAHVGALITRLHYWGCGWAGASSRKLNRRYIVSYGSFFIILCELLIATEELTYWTEILSGYFAAIVGGLWPSMTKSLILINTAGYVIPGYSSLLFCKVSHPTCLIRCHIRGFIMLSFMILIRRCRSFVFLMIDFLAQVVFFLFYKFF